VRLADGEEIKPGSGQLQDRLQGLNNGREQSRLAGKIYKQFFKHKFVEGFLSLISN
jgi:hypothetical protein